jgi:hypothetical protein
MNRTPPPSTPRSKKSSIAIKDEPMLDSPSLFSRLSERPVGSNAEFDPLRPTSRVTSRSESRVTSQATGNLLSTENGFSFSTSEAQPVSSQLLETIVAQFIDLMSTDFPVLQCVRDSSLLPDPTRQRIFHHVARYLNEDQVPPLYASVIPLMALTILVERLKGTHLGVNHLVANQANQKPGQASQVVPENRHHESTHLTKLSVLY